MDQEQLPSARCVYCGNGIATKKTRRRYHKECLTSMAGLVWLETDELLTKIALVPFYYTKLPIAYKTRLARALFRRCLKMV